MPRKRRTTLIQCRFFSWRLFQRDRVWYADGRSNQRNAGKHSLGTRDRDEALDRLALLDRQRAEDLGLVARSPQSESPRSLPLAEGRRLFDQHNARSRVTGGAKKSTQKRYRAILDKFLAFLKKRGITDWHGVDEEVLDAYASYLADLEYAADRTYQPKTIYGELNTLKTAIKWLRESGHLHREPIRMPLNKAESERAYCYTPEQVTAMIDLCKQRPELLWIGNAISVLACTGMRIEELASLKWSDIRFDNQTLTICDESGYSDKREAPRTTKNSRSRSLPVHQDLIDVLGKIKRQDAFIFHGPRGGRLKADTLRNCLIRDVIAPLKSRWPKPYADERGFEDGRLHSFRHYFCSVCANAGIPEPIVMEWLGHRDSEMVRHYYHLHDEESRRKMDQLNPLGTGGGCAAAGDEPNSTESTADRPPEETDETTDS